MKKSGCFVSNGNKTIELEIGWYKEWTCENVYGWVFHGPVEQWPLCGPYRNLIVLGYEPSMNEVKEIIERFKDALAPDGTKGLSYQL